MLLEYTKLTSSLSTLCMLFLQHGTLILQIFAKKFFKSCRCLFTVLYKEKFAKTPLLLLFYAEFSLVSFNTTWYYIIYSPTYLLVFIYCFSMRTRISLDLLNTYLDSLVARSRPSINIYSMNECWKITVLCFWSFCPLHCEVFTHIIRNRKK